jgi:hypothetical protein
MHAGRSSVAEARKTIAGIHWTMMGPRPAPGRPSTHLHAQAGMRRTGPGSSARSSCCCKGPRTLPRHRIHCSTLLQRSIGQGVFVLLQVGCGGLGWAWRARTAEDCTDCAEKRRGGLMRAETVPQNHVMCDIEV